MQPEFKQILKSIHYILGKSTNKPWTEKKRNRFDIAQLITSSSIAVFALITMIWSIHHAGKVTALTKVLHERDSVLFEKQLLLNKEQLDLYILEQEFARKRFSIDSSQNVLQLDLLESQLSHYQNELLLSQKPVIEFNPQTRIQKKNGKFHISLTNSGISDVIDVFLHEDYYIAVLDESNDSIFLKGFGVQTMGERIVIPTIDSKDTKSFELINSDIIDEMIKYRNSPEDPRPKIMLVKVQIGFHREVDRKIFTMNKLFFITDDGSNLAEIPYRGKMEFFTSFGYPKIRELLKMDDK